VAFRFEWELPDAAWREVAEAREREAPGSDYDRRRLPRYDLLTADVQMQADGRELFPGGGPDGRPGFNLSLLDLAAGIAEAFEATDFAAALPGAEATFHQADDQLEIGFTKRDGVVEVSTNLDRSPTLEVPEGELLAEVERLRTAVVAGLEEHAPGALEWETLEPLRR
jgi:hypothetical protein